MIKEIDSAVLAIKKFNEISEENLIDPGEIKDCLEYLIDYDEDKEELITRLEALSSLALDK